MGAWLAAWAGLGLRRLPYGLALRPTAAFARLENYPWRGRTLDFVFGPTGRDLALEIGGTRISGTLQVPEQALPAGGRHTVRLVAAAGGGPARPLWLRSAVQLDAVTAAGDRTLYRFTGRGLAAITFAGAPGNPMIADPQGTPIAATWSEAGGLHTCHFTRFGPATLACDR